MKELLSTILNWRFDVLCVLGITILALAFDETDRSMGEFFALKALAICLCGLFYWLVNKWQSQGYFNE